MLVQFEDVIGSPKSKVLQLSLLGLAMDSSSAKLKNPFWDFSLQVYGKRDLADILLWFQDECQMDINLVLYCCWAGVSLTPKVSPTEMTLIRRTVNRWQSEIVQPLRFLRQTLKADSRGISTDGVEDLRAIIQQAELNAERLQQDILHERFSRELNQTLDQEEGRRHVVSNLVLYLTEMWGKPKPSQMVRVEELADALFDG